jgi:hypothetical protein
MFDNLTDLQAQARARADEAAWAGDMEKARRLDALVARYAARIAAGEIQDPRF